MKKELLFTILASLALILLQVFWVFSIYQRYERQYTKQIDKAFLNAIEKEADLRSMQITKEKHPTMFIKCTGYKSKEKQLGHEDDTIDLAVIEQNRIAQSVSELFAQLEQDELISTQAFPILPIIDSLLMKDMSASKKDYYLSLYNRYGKIIDSLGNTTLQTSHQAITIRKPIGTKGLLYIQMKSRLPYDTILSQMFYSLIGSASILMLVLGCFIYQLMIIHKKDKLLKKRETNVNGTVHDLKSPLNALITLISWLTKNELDYQKKKLMNEVMRRAMHLTAQIEFILICARGTRQPIILKKTKVDPEKIIRTAIENICIELSPKSHNIEIINMLSRSECLADQFYLENVIKNLIENALKYSNDKVKIQIKIIEADQGIQIEIKDNGWGIPRKYQKKIFDQYYQIPQKRSQIQKGYGIGLSYVKYIIQAHGGKIQLISHENKGSTFKFYIPK